jgi:hypothetical protein
MVEGRAPAHGREDAGRQPDRERDDERAGRQLDGRGKQDQKLVQDRLLGDDRLAQVALQHLAQEAEVLLPQRPVETHLVQQPGVARRIDAALADQQLDGIAGDQANKGERRRRNPEEGGHEHEQAGRDKTEHVPPTNSAPWTGLNNGTGEVGNLSRPYLGA